MPIVLHRTAEVFVDASTVDLVGESLVAEFEPDWNLNGLAESDPDGEGVRIICGQETGVVDVTCELWDQPAPLQAASWQDIAEISAHWTSSYLDFGTTTQDDPACRLPLPAAGSYRVRVHGTHRDGDDPRPDSAPRETYLVQLWAAPPDGPTSLKSTSAFAASWRA
ncbi:hypothetical protein GCM10022243_53930 [Saccharothrix violaceirubra]|uniref:Uncharacterized protein n=1 Tax=Saccharothrix violaceirubra TaxID=413306 RepID=A0A7W7WTR6_9PSEU|nr:hypothetical protein [Saccharothrix violaceirubra]MBB4963455.1 hypothetical protein [Saccharothrix violaceirubra]